MLAGVGQLTQGDRVCNALPRLLCLLLAGTSDLGLLCFFDEQAQQATTLAHLELKVSTAACLASPQELRTWLAHYARRLATQGDIPRLRCLCDRLLGSRSSLASSLALSSAADKDTRVVEEDGGAWWNQQLGTVCKGKIRKHDLLLQEVRQRLPHSLSSVCISL